MVVVKRKAMLPMYVLLAGVCAIFASLFFFEESLPSALAAIPMCFFALVLVLIILDIMRVRSILIFDSEAELIRSRRGVFFKAKERIIPLTDINRFENIEPTDEDKDSACMAGCLFGALGSLIFSRANKNMRRQGIYVHLHKGEVIRLVNVSKQKATYEQIESKFVVYLSNQSKQQSVVSEQHTESD